MLESLIGAGASLLGRFIGSRMDADTARRNQEREDFWNQKNIDLQKEFAQQGIRWKAADARAAGIHPAFAMGAQTSSFSPISIDGGASSNYAGTFGAMGADISRAINATRTASERDDAFATSVKRLQLEGAQLDNDIKRASLASSVQRLTQQGNPPFPDANSVPTDKLDPRARLVMGGSEVRTDPRYSDTEVATRRYGESADWWYGPMVMWNDWNHHNAPLVEARWPAVREKFGRYMDYLRK